MPAEDCALHKKHNIQCLMHLSAQKKKKKKGGRGPGKNNSSVVVVLKRVGFEVGKTQVQIPASLSSSSEN